MSDKRRLTINSSSVTLPRGYSGLFESKTPGAAASKALKAIYRQSKTTSSSIHFVLRETTQDSKHKEYFYVGSKKQLSPPKDTGRKDAKGNTIYANFEYKIKADRSAVGGQR